MADALCSGRRFRTFNVSSGLDDLLLPGALPASTINSEFGSGNLEMNYMDGLRFKTKLDLMDGILTLAMLIGIFVLNISMIDQYLQTIMGVAFGGIEPALALEMREAEGEARQ